MRMELRLVLKDIQPGSGNGPLLQGGDEGRFIDDRPSCGIDQDGRTAHECEFWSTDQMSRLRRQGHVDRDDVRLAEEFRKITRRPVGAWWRVNRAMRVIDYLHPEAGGPPRDRLADPSHSHNAQDAPGDGGAQ